MIFFQNIKTSSVPQKKPNASLRNNVLVADLMFSPFSESFRIFSCPWCFKKFPGVCVERRREGGRQRQTERQAQRKGDKEEWIDMSCKALKLPV